MKKLIIILIAFGSIGAYAYSETDLLKLNALKGCNSCDLSGADLTTSKLTNTTLDGATFCKTQMPWGEVNDGC